jgi:hypothetical protein
MKTLAIYLNDHLAGSIGALEMLDDMIETHQGKSLESLLRNLRKAIDADQRTLKKLMNYLDIKESGVRKASAWLAEKLSRTKLRTGDLGKPNLALLQSLETLALGIAGKRSLWQMLRAATETGSLRTRYDFAALEKRASEQLKTVEAETLKIGRKIFSPELKLRTRQMTSERPSKAGN